MNGRSGSKSFRSSEQTSEDAAQEAVSYFEQVTRRSRYLITAFFSLVLLYVGAGSFVAARHYLTTIGISQPTGYAIAGGLVIAAIVLGFVALAIFLRARDLADAAQAEASLKAANAAIDKLAGSDDLVKLIQANRQQMNAYDALARSQAQTSYRASQIAMAVGLMILATGVAVVIFAHSDATKYAAAIITATGAATGGYITRTFINVHTRAADQMNFYFRQPLVQSYLLTAERLAQLLPEKQKSEQLAVILTSTTTES